MAVGEGEVGRIHFAPAIEADAPWVELRDWVRSVLAPKLEALVRRATPPPPP
eukprot:SAG11_NODE_512_length_8839_cov_5.600572_15_plen_51_part_01